MRIAFVTVAAALLATQAGAANLIDQNQPLSNTFMAAFSQTGIAQSFTTAQSAVSGGGANLIYTNGGGYSVTVGLWDALPNQAGAHQLASATGMTAGDGWFDAFWTPHAVTAGQTYYLTFDSAGPGGLLGTTYDTYAAGNVYASAGYGSFGGYDYTFRTYSSSTLGAVPEPATWGMTLVGFGAMGAAMRRRGANVRFA